MIRYVVNEITELLWDEHNISHVARQGVESKDLSEAVFSEVVVSAPCWIGSLRPTGRIRETDAGRALVVFLDTPTTDGRSYVLMARPMTRKEARGCRAMITKEAADD